MRGGPPASIRAQEASTRMVDAVAPPGFRPTPRAWLLTVLVLAYTSNFVDRSIVGVLGEAIKADLRLADWQLGVLGGLSFAIFYSVLGLPMARVAERSSRVRLIAVSLALWSGMTALCGLSGAYWQLLLCRIGVGVGEAGCSPAAHSLISDYVPPGRRASALSVYALGIPLGTMIGAFAGGWIAQTIGWRAAFVVVGLPGLILAVVLRLTVKEPPRGYAEPRRVVLDAPPLTAVIRTLLAKPAFAHLAAGAALTSFAGYGMAQFAAPFLVRAYGLDYAQAGAAWGLIGGASVGVGTLAGGLIADRAARRDPRWYAWIAAVGLVAAAPLYIAGFMQTRPAWAIGVLLLPGLFHYAYLGPTFAVVHGMVAPRMRASATALLFLIMNLIGLGLGPLAVGALSDVLAQRFYAGAGTFAAACPGGRAVAGASEAAAAACHGALVDGTRYALVAVLMVFFWAAAHFVMAGRTLRQALAAGTDD